MIELRQSAVKRLPRWEGERLNRQWQRRVFRVLVQRKSEYEEFQLRENDEVTFFGEAQRLRRASARN